MKRRRLPKIFIIFAVLAITFVPMYCWHNRHTAGLCSDNLRSLGQALLLYANENHNALPPNWSAIIMTQDVTTDVFRC